MDPKPIRICCLLAFLLLMLTGGIRPALAQEDGDPYVDEVVDFTPGDPINEKLLRLDAVSGPPDFDAQRLEGFLSLGVGGSVTVMFADNLAVDGRGADIRIYGDPGNDERWVVEVSPDGEVFYSFDDLPEVVEIDLAQVGLKEARFVRLTHDGQPGEGISPGPELDAIQALHSQSLVSPVPRQIALHAVEPKEAPRGQEVQVGLFGSGFGDSTGHQVSIGEFETLDTWVESGEVIRAVIYIPEGAEPGPRYVELSLDFDGQRQVIGLESGFHVVAPPQPAPPRQVALRVIEPREVPGGQEVEITLFGSGFADATSHQVAVGEFETRATWIESDEVIRAVIFIPEDAESGPRYVELSLDFDGEPQVLGLDAGLFVRSLPLAPTEIPEDGRGGGGDLLPDWAWAAVTVLLGGSSFAIGKSLGVKSKLTWTDKARLQWSVEAQVDLPRAQRACQWACKGSVKAALLDRWKVNSLDLTPLTRPKRRPQQVKSVSGAVLNPLNDLANLASLLQDEAAIRRQLAPIIEALLNQVTAWEREGGSPAAIRLEARLAAPINAQLELYHCQQTARGLDWGKPLLTWKQAINQKEGEFLGVLRGPTVGEDTPARLRQELETCLMELVQVARWKL